MTCQLWSGDCLQEMDRIEAGSVDMICADLPFNSSACTWDKLIPFKPLWKQYKRILKKNGVAVLFGSQPFTSMLVMSNLDWFRYEIIWEKDKPADFVSANKRIMKYHENILVFYSSQPTYNPQMIPRSGSGKARAMYPEGNRNKTSEHGQQSPPAKMYNPDLKNPKSVIFFNTVWRNISLHPTQKPVALLSYLIKTYTNPGELVLDNTMGSGSTGEACLLTGRRFIGIEKDLNFYQIASNRLEQVVKKLNNQDLPMFAIS